MDQEERRKRFFALPTEIQDYINSESTVKANMAVYEKWGIADITIRYALSALMADILIGITDKSLFGRYAENILGDRTKALGIEKDFINTIFNYLPGKSALAAVPLATPITPATPTLSKQAGDHDMDAEWYNKERTEILREIEGPHRNTEIPANKELGAKTITPGNTSINQIPRVSTSPQIKPLVTPTKPTTPFANAMVSATENKTGTPSNMANTLKTGAPLTQPSIATKQVVPTIFSMPRAETIIKAPEAKKSVAPNIPQNNTPRTDPYREPPTA